MIVSSRMKRSSFVLGVGAAQADEALELTGNGDEAVQRPAVALAQHLDGQRQPLVENEREGVRRVDGDGRQDGEHVR